MVVTAPPEMEIVEGELVELLEIFNVPCTIPAVFGAKLTCREADCPGAMFVPAASPLT